jgi:ABC-type polysaccharide/polyol phosphate transport system ATPase subunit
MKIIQFKNVWEMYKIKFVEDGRAKWESFWVLKDINFDVEERETIGIIGANGSGKSTLLKLIAGILKPDRGSIEIKGKVSGLLELGAGFDLEMTGRENIYSLACLFGVTPARLEEKLREITAFAGLGRFINAPVKCYSQGMFVRLAFSLAIHMDPDIFLIDDTLAVGDEEFQRKCLKKIFELKDRGKTIIFVTHDMNMLRRLCKRVIFLREGRIIKDGFVDKVVPLYTQMIGTKESVGVLERKPLTLVFNDGRLFLNWKDKLLTPNSGGYTTFLVQDRWYTSSQADWRVRKETDNKLVATGEFYQLGITQVWRLELINDYEIKWDIEVESKQPMEI